MCVCFLRRYSLNVHEVSVTVEDEVGDTGVFLLTAVPERKLRQQTGVMTFPFAVYSVTSQIQSAVQQKERTNTNTVSAVKHSPQPSGCSASPGPTPAPRPGSASPSPGPPRWDARSLSSPVHRNKQPPWQWHDMTWCLGFWTLTFVWLCEIFLTWTEKLRLWQLWPPGGRNRLLGWCRSDSSRTARDGKRLSSSTKLYQTAGTRKRKRKRINPDFAGVAGGVKKVTEFSHVSEHQHLSFILWL